MNGEQYAKARGVKFDWTADGHKSDPAGWQHRAFTVTLTVGNVTESFPWKQGLGVDEPAVGEVLWALASDAQSGEQSFYDFAADYGYDTDSRKAYATWEQCQHIAEQLQSLFGEIPVIDDEDDE